MKMSCFIGKSIFLYFLINCTHIAESVTVNKQVLKFSQPSQCKNNEYFNTSLLSCIKCDVRKNLRPSVDGLRCICNKFSKKIGFKDGFPICIPCGMDATVTADGNDCVSCNMTTCQCASNEIQIDRSLNGTLLHSMYCLHCPNNTHPFFNGPKCVSCKSLEYDYIIRHHTLIKDHCLPKRTYNNTDVQNLFQMKFESQVIDSYYLRSELQIAIHFCEENDILACEHLANICALSLYNNNVACAFFVQSENRPEPLFYNKSENTAILNSKQITQDYSLSKSDNYNLLNFTVSTFSLHGHLKSLDTMNSPCNLLELIKFGINLKKKCKLPIRDLLQAKVEFMSPYLKFIEGNNILLYALPVLIKNVNQNSSKISDWLLVRKFFFVDNIGGVRTLLNITNGKIEKAANLSVLRYMKSLSIIIDVQNAEERNKIFPPLIIIEYAELTYEQINKIVKVTLDFEVKFTLKDNKIDTALKIIIGILSGLSLILCGIKTWSYSKQHHTSTFTIPVIVWFFVHAVGSVGSVIILCLIFLCLYLFIFYKGQALPHVLLPEDIGRQAIRTFTIIAFLFKFVEVLGFFCRFWNIDIFFIDWEQPRSIYNRFKHSPPHASTKIVHINKPSRNKYKHSEVSLQTTIKRNKNSNKLNENSNSDSSSKSIGFAKYKNNLSTVRSTLNNISINDYNEHPDLPTSIWRSYFIANQWLNLQTKRKINVTVQVIAVLFTYQVIQVYPWLITIPELTFNFYEENYNFILYYTVCTLIYVLIYSIQWSISIIFYERCITNKMQVFVDLCSITNISVLILPFRYYGFYIHGRSVHGFADTDLLTLINDLQMEKNNLCAHRGLVPGTTQQTFILSLTKTFRIALNQNSDLPTTSGYNLKNIYSAINWEQIFSAQTKNRQFLCNFIDHCIKNEDYIVKDQHFLEILFNVVFPNTEEKSIFFIDNNYSFNHALLYGNEWLLATFEISVFFFTIVLYENCVLASVLTALSSLILMRIVNYRGKQNLITNTLLDKTFLTT